MQAIKAALGVTLTDRAGSQGTCTLERQTPGPGAWTGVNCSSTGAVVGIDLSSNLFQRRLDVFVSAVSALKALKNIKLNRNYLTGTVPAFKASLKALNMASNLLSGAFPAISLTTCDARSNCRSSTSKCDNAAGTAQWLSSERSVCGSTDASGVLCGGGLCAPDASAPAASSTPNTDGQPLLPLSCLGVPMDAAMGLALLSVKASLGVTFTDWNVDAPYALAGQAVVPGLWSSVVCDATGKVLTLELNNNLFSGRPDSFLTPLLPVKTLKVLCGTAECIGIAGSVVHLLGGELAVCRGGSGSTARRVVQRPLQLCLQTRLPVRHPQQPIAGAFTTSFKALTSLKQAHPLPPLSAFPHTPSTPLLSYPLHSSELPTSPPLFLTHSSPSQPYRLAHGSNFNFNWFAGSIPSALVGIASLTLFGASYNYLYGPVPKLGTALKAIDVPKNWLAGTLPGTGFLSCSASSNCLTSTGACNTTGTTQHPLASCAVCDSPKGTDPICAGGTCAPNTAGPLASSTTPTASSPILPRFCVGVPLNAAQAVFLLSVKTTLGVTFTEWYASYLTVSPKAKTKAMGWRRLAESEASRERVLLVAPPSGQAGLCTIQGQTPVPGSWRGIFCSSAGIVVGL
ncbi:unnamed protein product [Closterium sp. NIES-65]|nr:unnamed protein product [Closterium sp. NIES-65]